MSDKPADTWLKQLQSYKELIGDDLRISLQLITGGYYVEVELVAVHDDGFTIRDDGGDAVIITERGLASVAIVNKADDKPKKRS